MRARRAGFVFGTVALAFSAAAASCESSSSPPDLGDLDANGADTAFEFSPLDPDDICAKEVDLASCDRCCVGRHQAAAGPFLETLCACLPQACAASCSDAICAASPVQAPSGSPCQKCLLDAIDDERRDAGPDVKDAGADVKDAAKDVAPPDTGASRPSCADTYAGCNLDTACEAYVDCRVKQCGNKP